MTGYKPIWIKAIPKEGELRQAPHVEGEYTFGRLTHLQVDFRRDPSSWFIVAFDPYSRDITPDLLKNFTRSTGSAVIEASPYTTTQDALRAAQVFLDKNGFKSTPFTLEEAIDDVEVK